MSRPGSPPASPRGGAWRRPRTPPLPGGARAGRAPARSVTAPLQRVVQVGPGARRTVRRRGTAAPDLDALLDAAAPLLPRLRAIGTQGKQALQCIRPYAPEVAGLFTTWG